MASLMELISVAMFANGAFPPRFLALITNPMPVKTQACNGLPNLTRYIHQPNKAAGANQ
jgi:hypothetical protein